MFDCSPLAGSQGSDTIIYICMGFPTWTNMNESIYMRVVMIVIITVRVYGCLLVYSLVLRLKLYKTIW